MAGASVRLIWVVRFTMAEELWFHEERFIRPLVELVAKTGWWPKLEIMGWSNSDYAPRPLAPLEERVEEVFRRLIGGEGEWTLVKGDARAAAFTNETDLFLSLDLRPGYFAIAAGASGNQLEELKGHALEDLIELILGLRRAWPEEIQLTHASAAPGGNFSYDRMKPPRVARRPLHAIADLFDPQASEEERALAHAEPPPGSRREERDGVTILRCVDDPSNVSAVRAAASVHERWMADVIQAPVDDEWTEEDS
jgi:hypothetical protein